MSLILAIWHVVPGWLWGGGTLAIVVLVALALFAPEIFANVIRSLGKLVALIPWGKWQTWALIAGAAAPLAFLAWLQVHDQAIRDADARHEEGAVKAAIAARIALEKESNDRYAAQLADLQHFIDGQRAQEAAKLAELAAQAAREAAARKSAEDALAKGRSRNVAPDVVRSYPSLPLGVVLQFNAGATDANGGDDLAVAAAAAGDGRDARAASGVALDTYSRAVEGAHRALRACRDQVLDWQRRDREVIEPALDTAAKIISSCTPKGASP